jgi:hypothetical protein
MLAIGAPGRGFGQGAAEGEARAFGIRKMLMQRAPVVVLKGPQPQASGFQRLRDQEVRSIETPAHFLIAPLGNLIAGFDMRVAQIHHRRDAERHGGRLPGKRNVLQHLLGGKLHADFLQGRHHQCLGDGLPHHAAADLFQHGVDQHLVPRIEFFDLLGRQPEFPVDRRNQLQQQADIAGDVHAWNRNQRHAAGGGGAAPDHGSAGSADPVEFVQRFRQHAMFELRVCARRSAAGRRRNPTTTPSSR